MEFCKEHVTFYEKITFYGKVERTQVLLVFKQSYIM